MTTPGLDSTARAHPNLALIKYWGNRDDALRIPSNGSISMALGAFTTTTHVRWDPGRESDRLAINSEEVQGPGVDRVRAVLDEVRSLASLHAAADVTSRNSFAHSAGLAASASGFAALALAASDAAGLRLDSTDLSRLARRGSGSAARSIPGGWVEWHAGKDDRSSFAEQIAPPDHWELIDLVALIDTGPKRVGSSEGHRLAHTSPLQPARLGDADRRLDECRRAVIDRDLEKLASVAEWDSNLMHAVMATSEPPLIYLTEATIRLLEEVPGWRRSGLGVFYSVDAGANVHLVTQRDDADAIAALAQAVSGVRELLRSSVGGPTLLVKDVTM